MEEKISDLERRLSRDVAATRDVESLRAELQVAKTKIDQLQTDDNVVQYTFSFALSLSAAAAATTTIATIYFWFLFNWQIFRKLLSPITFGISVTEFLQPDVLPVTQPTASKHCYCLSVKYKLSSYFVLVHC